MIEMFENIWMVLLIWIDNFEWMMDEIKVWVQEKLVVMIVKIVYFEVWIDYFELDVVLGDLMGNICCYCVWLN